MISPLPHLLLLLLPPPAPLPLSLLLLSTGYLSPVPRRRPSPPGEEDSALSPGSDNGGVETVVTPSPA